MGGTFNGVSVVSLEGSVSGPRPVMRRVDRQGVAGTTFEVVSRQAPPFTLRLQSDVSSASTASAFRIAIEALVGQTVGFTLSTGVAYTNCTVLDVREVANQQTGYMRGGVSGGTSGYFVVFDIDLQYPGGYA